MGAQDRRGHLERKGLTFKLSFFLPLSVSCSLAMTACMTRRSARASSSWACRWMPSRRAASTLPFTVRTTGATRSCFLRRPGLRSSMPLQHACDDPGQILLLCRAVQWQHQVWGADAERKWFACCRPTTSLFFKKEESSRRMYLIVSFQTQHPGFYFRFAAQHTIARRRLCEKLCIDARLKKMKAFYKPAVCI